ncbi:MAG: DUF1538 domain-containing protein [Clostridia bacterium]|nr:DUF1538 domain-containing protein [Clostridia bacterium]
MLIRFIKDLWETARNVVPIIVVLITLQTVVMRKEISDIKVFILGCIFSILGLHLFLKGVTTALIPLGEGVGRGLIQLERKYLIVVFAFMLGYASTLVEPALKALALEVEEISIGAIPEKVLINTVAVGFGIGLSIGIAKILNNIPTKKILIPLLVITLILTYFAPDEFVGIAFDSASATTGPVNIPINMALAMGLAKILGEVDPLLNGFGIIGLTSMGTVLTVLSLGIFMR